MNLIIHYFTVTNFINFIFREDLESQLTMANYDIKFHLLLYLEDVQQEIDIKAYDMDSVSLTKCTQNRNPLLSITVSYYVSFVLTFIFKVINGYCNIYIYI